MKPIFDAFELESCRSVVLCPTCAYSIPIHVCLARENRARTVGAAAPSQMVTAIAFSQKKKEWKKYWMAYPVTTQATVSRLRSSCTHSGVVKCYYWYVTGETHHILGVLDMIVNDDNEAADEIEDEANGDTA